MNSEDCSFVSSALFRDALQAEKFFKNMVALIAASFAYLFFGFMIELFPLPFSEYYYMVIPAGLFAMRHKMPASLCANPRFAGNLARLPLLTLSLLLLSPFWVWWKNFPSNGYLTCNSLLLGIVFFALLGALASISASILMNEGFFFSALLAKFARMTTIYINICPLIALLVLSLLGICTGETILNYLASFAKPVKLLYLAPPVLALLSVVRARVAMSWKLKKL